MKSLTYSALLTLVLFSCNPSRNITRQVPGANNSRQEYIQQYAPLAVREMNRTGIPASITLAQALLESDNGNSRLAIEGNNHFGIKCHSDWKGKRIYHDDDKRDECFRKYRDVEESFRDHSDFLVKGSRYNFLFDYKRTDYKAWAKGLRKAGYATNRKYADLLIRIIEDNHLHQYDRGRTALRRGFARPDYEEQTELHTGSRENRQEFSVSLRSPRIKQNNRIDYIIVSAEDTFSSLAGEFDLLAWELHRYNELSSDARLKEGMMLYLQPKRRKAAPGHHTHKVQQGETMYSISQKYGIKLRFLYQMNDMNEGEEPEAGTILVIR